MPIQSFKEEVTWPTAWKKNYNDATACPPPNSPRCGILQVTVNFTDQKDLDLKPTNGLCLPHTFCTANGDSCGCALDENVDPLVKANPNIKDACQKACSKWAVKDLDFPKTGPLGFSFKLSNFVPDGKGQAHRPAPKSFPTTASTSNPDWTTQFSRTSKLPEKTSGKCYYAKIPGSADCPVQ
jgi:hypothetical protein